MKSDPIVKPSSSSGHMYEYGEYDGVVDLEAILHDGANTNANHNTTTTAGGGAVAVSPTPNLSCLVDSDDAGDNSNIATLQGNRNNTGNSGEQGHTPSSHGRSPSWKPHQDSVSRGSAQISNNFALRSNGGYPMTMDEGDVTLLTSTPVAVTAAGSRGGPHKRGECAKSNRIYSATLNHNRNNTMTAATTNTSTTSNTTNDGVHLPVIMPSQQRRPTEPLIQPRVRVSPLTQEMAATEPMTIGVNFGPTTAANARTATNVSPLAQTTRPAGGSKTVMSSNNLSSLQRNGNDRVQTGPLSSGTSSSNKAPPYLAPALSPLHTRTHLQHTSVTATVTGPNSNPNNSDAPTSASTTTAAAFAIKVVNRPVTDGTVKRRESAKDTQPSAPHAAVVDITSSITRSNGWVKEEVNRIQRSCQEVSAGFPQDRVRQSSAHSTTTNSSENVPGSVEKGGRRDKVNTSPVPTSLRAPVWSNDYEVGRTDLVGITSMADFGAMPKVVAPPLQKRAGKTLSDSNNKRVMPFRPPPPVLSTPLADKTSPVESIISPLQTVAPQCSPRQSDGEKLEHATITAIAQPPSAQQPLISSPAGGKNNGKLNTALANSVDLNSNGAHSSLSHQQDVSRISNAAPHPNDAAAAIPHVPNVVAHRRIMMKAVDTHASALLEITGDRKGAAAAAVSSGTARAAAAATTQHDASKGTTSTTEPTLPYTDSRRAALEAWAAFPALDITIRGQAPSPTQLRRERDLTAARPLLARQLYRPVKGQAPQEFAGEPFEMNYDVHNVVVQLRHRNRPLMMTYPARLPLDLDNRPRLRRQRTPRSFYGKKFPHMGDAWFRNALDDAQHIDSPDIESMEKREEEEFLRNGGDPAHRRNRYGQANNHNGNNGNNNNNNNTNNNQQQQQPQRPSPHAGTGAPNIGQINRNTVKMEQPAV